MSNTWNNPCDCKEKEYYYDMECCKKQDKCWDDKCYKKQDECWDDKCCKKQDKCCKKHDKCWKGECCKKHDMCWEDECCKKHDKCCDEKCCKRCDCCHETKELLKEAYKYAFRARLAILAIFEYKNPCENREAIKYFLCKAKKAVKCLFKILEKLYWCFNKKCFHCEYEAANLIQKAIRNAESVAYTLCGIEKLCDHCCNECECCEEVYLISVALEEIEDVVREIETLFKLLKKRECKKC